MYISITPTGTTNNGITCYELDVETRAVPILHRLLELFERADDPEQIEGWLDLLEKPGVAAWATRAADRAAARATVTR